MASCAQWHIDTSDGHGWKQSEGLVDLLGRAYLAGGRFQSGLAWIQTHRLPGVRRKNQH